MATPAQEMGPGMPKKPTPLAPPTPVTHVNDEFGVALLANQIIDPERLRPLVLVTIDRHQRHPYVNLPAFRRASPGVPTCTSCPAT